jgi:hypothetical protein
MTRPTGPRTFPAVSIRSRAPDGSNLPARVIHLADPGWCWTRLRSTALGVLSSQSPAPPVAEDVTYTVVGGEIVVPVPWDSEALHLLAGHEVTLGLSGRGEDGLRWVLRASGVAEFAMVRSSPVTLEDCRSSHPAHGPAFASTDTMLVAVDRLRGYHETPLDG